MELHSYAKKKTSKKLTTEQKRKLIETRIAYDGFFSKKPARCQVTWKKIIHLAKLEDVSVPLVRKQWANLVAKYEQYKKSNLDNLSDHGVQSREELLSRINSEWEFFMPLHRFMSRKQTHLHSYALTQSPRHRHRPRQLQEQEHQRICNASLQRIFDREDEHVQNNRITHDNSAHVVYAAAEETIVSELRAPETSMNLDSQSTNRHELQSQNTPANTPTHTDNESLPTGANGTSTSNGHTLITNGQRCEATAFHEYASTSRQVEELDTRPSCSNGRRSSGTVTTNCKKLPRHSAHTFSSRQHRQKRKRQLTERDKYYRHKRRFDRRLEQRFDAVLNVLGQIVKVEYPSVDVSALLSEDESSSELEENQHGNGVLSDTTDEDDSDMSSESIE